MNRWFFVLLCLDLAFPCNARTITVDNDGPADFDNIQAAIDDVGTVDGGVQPNVIASHSTAVIDVRVPTLADGKKIEKLIHNIKPEVPGVRLRIEGAIGRPSMESTPRNEALWKKAKQIGKQLGLDLSRARVGGGSDGNTTSQFTATLDGLGPVGHGAHANREFLYIDRTLERAALLAMLLLSPAGSKEQPGGPG